MLAKIDIFSILFHLIRNAKTQIFVFSPLIGVRNDETSVNTIRHACYLLIKIKKRVLTLRFLPIER